MYEVGLFNVVMRERERERKREREMNAYMYLYMNSFKLQYEHFCLLCVEPIPPPLFPLLRVCASQVSFRSTIHYNLARYVYIVVFFYERIELYVCWWACVLLILPASYSFLAKSSTNVLIASLTGSNSVSVSKKSSTKMYPYKW